MSVYHAALVRGWLLGRSDVPDDIRFAVDVLVETSTPPTVTQPHAADHPSSSPATASMPICGTQEADDQPTETLTPLPAPKQRKPWSPEARAAAADRMRAMQAAKKEKQTAPGEARAPSAGGA